MQSDPLLVGAFPAVVNRVRLEVSERQSGRAHSTRAVVSCFLMLMQVTHCFPALPPEDDLDDNATYDSRYEVRMVKALKEVREGARPHSKQFASVPWAWPGLTAARCPIVSICRPM